MNPIEKIVYDAVKGNPKLKFLLRNTYQGFYDLLPDKKDYFKSYPICKEGFFFGFHDICPFSDDEKYVLANKIEIPLKMPQKDDLLTVGYWSDNFQKFNTIGKTRAWNYHKGCRLQWIKSESGSVIFNDAEDNKEVARIYSINTGLLRTIPCPIDTVSPKGDIATSFSYERLEKFMPGYGYVYSDSSYLDEKKPDNTGLFTVDLKSGERKLILSLGRLSGIKHEKSMDNAFHYVTHTEFSPTGDKISFLHRWTDDPSKRQTRLVTCDLDGSNVQISDTTGMVSHYIWDKKGRVVAYCQVNGIDGHYLFEDSSLKNPRRVAHLLNSDGHQSFVPSKNMFITDTYPDKRRYSKLYLVDIDNDESTLIADVKSPKKFQSPDMFHHWACDLHPRVSPSGKYVCFDSVCTGERSLCVMSLM